MHTTADRTSDAATPAAAARGHRVFAACYDRLGAAAERSFLGALRADLLRAAGGAVLELGGGTGGNLPHYPDVTRLVVTEPDPHMRRRLAPRAAAAGAEVSSAPAERLPYADATFDTVVATLVLCTVDDPAAAVAEARRVLRPGGRLLFLEHVRAEGRVARLQERVTPLWRRVSAGCHLDRDTVATIVDGGFRVETLRELGSAGAGRLQPLVRGVASA